MNAHSTPPNIPPTPRFKPTPRFHRWLAGFGQTTATALLLLLTFSAGNAAAQVATNCISVICPPQVITNWICNDVAQPVPYPLVVSNSCPNLPFAVVCNPPAGTPLPPGATTVNCTVTAGGAVVANCRFTVRVLIDDVPPELTQARLWLVESSRIGFAIGLDLLGVSAPESM